MVGGTADNQGHRRSDHDKCREHTQAAAGLRHCDAGDAVDAALAAPTKQETVYYWQKVFGSSFQV